MDSPVTIIGAGPAGIACAIQLRHAGIDFVFISEGSPGGRLSNAHLVENYPGLEPLSGRELIQRLVGHLRRSSIEVQQATAEEITYSLEAQSFGVKSSIGRFCSPYLVMATGTLPKRIPAFEIPERTFYEVAEMEKVEHSQVMVVGSGEAAWDGALSLASRGNTVHILAKEKSAPIAKKLRDKLEQIPTIILHPGVLAESVTFNGERLFVQTRSQTFQGDYLLISVGREANKLLIENQGSIPAGQLFICGAAKSGRLGQTAMAVGDGVSAAMVIIHQRG